MLAAGRVHVDLWAADDGLSLPFTVVARTAVIWKISNGRLRIFQQLDPSDWSREWRLNYPVAVPICAIVDAGERSWRVGNFIKHRNSPGVGAAGGREAVIATVG